MHAVREPHQVAARVQCKQDVRRSELAVNLIDSPLNTGSLWYSFVLYLPLKHCIGCPLMIVFQFLLISSSYLLCLWHFANVAINHSSAVRLGHSAQVLLIKASTSLF